MGTKLEIEANREGLKVRAIPGQKSEMSSLAATTLALKK